MKLFNKILFGAAAISVMGAFSSCKEEATLSGADAVYIEMANTNVTLLVGDTLKLEARVSNVAGKDIETPISWSVADDKVLEIVDIVEKKKVVNPNYNPSAPAPTDPATPGEGEGEGENPGEGEDSGDENVASRAGETDAPVNTTDRYITVEYHYPGITPVKGSQGKVTSVRASLENGQFAITSVTVGRNALAGCVTPVLDEDVSYNDYKNDVVWFDVDPIAVVDDYDVSFTIDMLEVLTPEDKIPAGESTFIYPDPDFTLGVMHDVPDSEDPVEVRLPVKDGIVIDRELKRVGVVFTAPRLAGKSKVTLTIGNEEGSASASMTLYLFPRISGGLMYEKNGETLYPNFSDKNPSNEKPRMATTTMDINSSHYVACCMGLSTGRPDDIENARLAEEAGYFKWEIEGSAVVVEESFTSTEKLTGETYISGYISYLKVRSGVREGTARCTYTFPGPSVDTDDPDNVFVTDITVMNFNESYPVDKILVATENKVEIPDDGHVDASVGRTLSLDVWVEPDASFTYHIPEITSSDPSILEVLERGATDGYVRRFQAHRLGDVTLTMTSLGVTKKVHVSVNDYVSRIEWNEMPGNLPVGGSQDASLFIRMGSNENIPASTFDGEITWTSSDPSVVSVTPQANPIFCTVNGLAEGTATITATVKGKNIEGQDAEWTVTSQVSIFQNSTIEFTEDNYSEAMMDGDNMQIVVLDAEENEYVFLIPADAVAAGTYTGSDGTIQCDKFNVEGTAEYNLTIVDNGDGTYTLTGTITDAASGADFKFTGLILTLVE